MILKLAEYIPFVFGDSPGGLVEQNGNVGMLRRNYAAFVSFSLLVSIGLK